MIFFDVDVALVADPLPHMILGEADLVVSSEIKTCTFPSLMRGVDWNHVQPNTGMSFCMLVVVL